MTDRIQLITIETTIVPTIKRQLISIETSAASRARQQLVTFETDIHPPLTVGVEIAESLVSDIFFDGNDEIEIAEKIESLIVFPQTFTIVGDVEIAEHACSITSEPKLLIIQGTIEIAEEADHVFQTEITFEPTVKEAIQPTAFNSAFFTERFQTCYQVIINGVDYSEVVIDVLNINKSDNSVVSFDVSIMSQRELMDFIFKEIKINMSATDAFGKLEIIEPIVIGQIIAVDKNAKTGIYNLSCLDYGGFHNTLGEYISKEITPMIDAEIIITTEGTIDTGHKPILSVRVRTDDPEDPIRDGTDYFVNPLAGTITVPETSRLVGSETMFDYEYPDNFDTLEELMDSIAAEKGWTLDKSDVTIEEYTEPSKHPIITLSDESIIDMIRKFCELSAAKIDTSLFPTMRMYSELVNFFKAPIRQFTYERDMIDGSLDLGINVEGFINKQIVTSGNKVFPNAELGDGEVIKTDHGIIPFEPTGPHFNYSGTPAFGRPSKAQVQADIDAFLLTIPTKKVIYEIIVDDPSITNSDIIPYGQWFRTEPTIYVGFPNTNLELDSDGNQIARDGDNVTDLSSLGGLTGFRDIVRDDWQKVVEGGVIKFQLLSTIIVQDNIDGAIPTETFTVGYEGATFAADITAQPVSYNQGSLDTNVEVTACRPATGTNDIYGDTYENAYIETAEQAGNIANSILLTKGNVYSSIFTIPLHKGSNLRIGDRITIYFNNNREHTGLIKELDYSVDFNTASAIVTIRTEGVK